MTTFEKFAETAKDITPDRESLSPESLQAIDEDIRAGIEFDASRVKTGLPSQLHPENIEELPKS